MRIEFLELLECPKCRSDLGLDDGYTIEDSTGRIDFGRLTCRGIARHEFNIRNGIPRFVLDEGYSENFGWQWNRWARVQFEDQNIGGPMEGHTTRMFEMATNSSAGELVDKSVLDVGCGPGRFSDVCLRQGARLVIGLDYSSAIDAAKDNFQGEPDKLLLIQGDALRIPLKQSSVDRAFSIGVLHHTPGPSVAVTEMVRVVGSGGKVSVSVYPKSGYYTLISTQMWRNFFKFLRPLFGFRPSLVYAHIAGRVGFYARKISRFLHYPLQVIIPNVNLPDLRWVILDTFDSVTPSYQSGHSPEQVKDWLAKAGCIKLEETELQSGCSGEKPER